MPHDPMPPELKEIKRMLGALPGVVQSGITLTDDGRWALRLWAELAKHSELAAKCVALARGFPVLIEPPPRTMEARPAIPSLGE